ncbi:aromatic-ring-hydroxylating dioxygenase subunit beta [Pusillimonas sp.]|uniref:aromatic-ring-hydroxylating dioxygenase subunit beta n=1 Tax=Pusillimonas sp. TaxID=3040095 RepID=UPI0037C7706B
MNLDEVLEQRLADFVYLENRLLDDGRYDEWYDLFADDGVYWVPARPEQQCHESEPSIALESKMLLKLRIQRLRHGRAHSLSPKVRSLRVVQKPHVPAGVQQAALHSASCNLFYMETQAQDQLILCAKVDYQLRDTNGQFNIVRKRVQLLNADTALPAIQLFI